MTRRAVGLGGRRIWPLTLAAALLLALLAGLVHVALRQAPQAEPPAPGAVPGTVDSPAASASIMAPTPAPNASKASPVAAVPQSTGPATSQTADMPYRYIGKSASGAETSIVLFGRGRIVTLRGPGRLDDEYVVEAVFDEYLVLRHVPTGVGKFLALAQRQQVVEPPRDPEDSPRD